MKKTIFIKNAAILTVSGLVLRFFGVIFKVWLASNIGSEGIGLYQVIFSVFVFASTFATSGISTAITRLCAEELSSSKGGNVRKIVKKGVVCTLVIAFVSVIVLLFGADFIAKNIVFDKRAVLSIKVMAISLPFMGLCSCFRGYFIAQRKATPPSLSQIFEQIIRIAVVFIAVNATKSKGLYFCCAAIFLGDAVAEILSCVFLYIVYIFSVCKNKTLYIENEATDDIYKKIKEIAFPITLGRYLNSALRTCENVLVPKFLNFYKSAKQSALSQFGMIKGMALPLLFFPSALLNILSTLLIPELSEAKAKGQKYVVGGIVGRFISVTAVASYIFSAIFLVLGEKIGFLIYKSAEVGFLIKILSPIVPLMYIDSICDGMLKGLGQQKFTFFTSVSDSAVRILLVILVLPKFGLMGFIAIMYFSNLYTGILNLKKVIFTSEARFDLYKTVVLPLISAFCITLLVDSAVKALFYPPISVYIILVSSVSVALYLIFITKFADINVSELIG
ncbi:MAG: oligosaccharide flippase family protein [Clostridia bacterium]|nr:oligosaccharide flippase family protein [Clostridia bacterium]